MEDTQNNEQHARVDNRAAAYANAGPVYNGPVSHQHVSNHNEVRYEIDKEDNEWKVLFSKFLVKALTEKGAWAAGIVPIASGLALVYAGIQQVPAFLVQLIQPSDLILYGFFALLLGGALLGVMMFREKTRCKNCGAYHQLLEIADGEVRELETSEGVRKTVRRHYKCSACGHLDTRKKVDVLTE